MENTETVGSLLKRERESRGLSLQDVQDATKITVQNLSALEEDKFDYFPNRVYTRAFLRDYANYLGLDSVALLARYEGLSSIGAEPSLVPPRTRRSAWRVVAGTLVTIVVVGALGVAGYMYMNGRGLSLTAGKTDGRMPLAHSKSDGATLPKAPVMPKPEPPKAVVPKPVIPTVPVKPDKMTIQVAALEPVWVRITADGQRVYEATLPKGAVKTCQGKQTITVRAGKLGAVQVKWNGVKQPPLGSLRESGEKDFLMVNAPMTRVAPVAPSTPVPTTLPARPAVPAAPTPPASQPTSTKTPA